MGNYEDEDSWGFIVRFLASIFIVGLIATVTGVVYERSLILGPGIILLIIAVFFSVIMIREYHLEKKLKQEQKKNNT